MTYLTGEVTVIHDGDSVNFTAFTYSAVYCNVAGPITFTINGSTVSMELGDTIEVVVDGNTTVVPSGAFANNLLFLGNPNPVQTEFRTGLISGGTTEVYRFVNIKNGNPTDG